ncbi:MAG: Na/Pi symporter [Xanthomonadaceae bacterium]|jgi:phosphate:Na+ symporter|nr:Na/Pi symporter [Xanthomonadaceae bacterium]
MIVVAGIVLAASFWYSNGWLQLSAGLCIFLFGMQCLEEGLRLLAGGKLEQMLGRSTSTPRKSLLFGIGATMLMQSSTLVSLLAIAFISAGLIKLTAGIAILLGINLGATSGIWLLAMAGQGFNLNSVALPLVVFGVLAGFLGDRGKAVGRMVLGVAFILLGIDQIKYGFSDFTYGVDFTQYQIAGWKGILFFIGIGMAVTVVLQSSHATLMLVLTALAAGQLELMQGFALAIGSNVGSSVTTALVGALGGNRNGQRLALAHVIFNVITAALATALLTPLAWVVQGLTGLVRLGGNELIQLALFHSLINGMGVMLFWPLQGGLARLLKWVLPDRREPEVLIAEAAADESPERIGARYLTGNAAQSADSAAVAMVEELKHLGRLSIEIVCHALYLPMRQVTQPQIDDELVRAAPEREYRAVEDLYQRYIKGVYADILSFMGRLDVPLDEQHQQFGINCQMAALQLVDAVKDAENLQKNLGDYLRREESAARRFYVELRIHMLRMLREIYELGRLDVPDDAWIARSQIMDEDMRGFEQAFRERLFVAVRTQQLDGIQMSSLMNDISFASRIIQSLRNVLMLSQGEGNGMFHDLRRMTRSDDEYLIDTE